MASAPRTSQPTSSLLRSINRAAILNLIRENAPIARSQIARRLEISIPTVMRVVDMLIEEDLIRPHGANEASGGRPRPLLEFNDKAYAVVGIDLGGTQMLGSVADLAGSIQHEIDLSRDGNSPEQNLKQLCALIEQLLKAPRPSGQRIRGIGIGTPGVTLSDKGVVTWAPSLGWQNLDLKKILSESFDLPVYVENDVNLAALGELGFGAGRGTHNLVNISVGTGIGTGVIVDGALYRGHHEAAGEAGYLLPSVAYLGRQYDGFGPLESLASTLGMAERARQLIASRGLPPPPENFSAEDVFAAARKDESWACQVVDETVDYLSLAVASISVLLDPEMIVLGGSIVQHADLLIERVLERIRGTVPYQPRLVPSTLGRRATVMGVIMLILNGTGHSGLMESLARLCYGNNYASAD